MRNTETVQKLIYKFKTQLHENGITYEQIQKDFNIKPSRYDRMMNKEFNILFAAEICDYYGLNINEILTIDNTKSINTVKEDWNPEITVQRIRLLFYSVKDIKKYCKENGMAKATLYRAFMRSEMNYKAGPSAATIFSICKTFKVSSDYLLGLTNE